MLRISKKSEYALIALKYLYHKADLISAREISQRFNIPPEIMAKILQGLSRAGFIESIKGAHGGYKLMRNLKEISLGEIVEIVDGRIGIVECQAKDNIDCIQYCLGVCNIYQPFTKIQKKFEQFLQDITLLDLVEESSANEEIYQ